MMNTLNMTYNENQKTLILNDEKIHVTPCFPWKAPTKFLSIQSQKGEEVGFLESLEELDLDLMKHIIDELEKKKFIFDVLKILSIKDGHQIRTFEVMTKSGGRSFMVEAEAWPEKKDQGNFVLEDIHGDFYSFHENILDLHSQKMLRPYVA